MCMICVEYQKQKMTLREAWRAYGEMVEGMDPNHAKDVKKMLEEEEQKQKPSTKTKKP